MTDGLIYFIQEGLEGPIKVGYSRDPGKRLMALQGSHYQQLHLIGLASGIESQIHGRLTAFALGREWYRPAPEVLAEIEEPIARVSDALAAAVTAREHLQRAIALLRNSDGEEGREELDRVVPLLAEVRETAEALA